MFERLGKVDGLFVAVMQRPNAAAAIKAFVVYLQRVTKRTEGEVKMAIKQGLGDSVFEQIFYAGERMEREAQRNLLKRQLRKRFGELPPWVAEQLRLSDFEDLGLIGERLLDAKTLEEALNVADKPKEHPPAE